MAGRIRNVRHVFGGGWSTDFGPNADVVPDASGRVVIPFLVDAENVYFELDGGVHKIGGTTAVNSSAVGGGNVVTGLYDYWRQGTGGSPTQRQVIHVGTVCLADDGTATFSTSLFTGLASAAVPSYDTFDDLLIIASDSSADVPRSWDGTTAQNLAGSPPRFSFSTHHKGRQFAAGVYANPSTLYYSVAFDPEDWTGGGSGSIQIDPNDGDMITAIASYKEELWIFKGPNKGSIHRLTGSSSSDFAVKPFVKSGLGAVWHNSVFQFKDDLGFMSQYGTVHSLMATSAFGDYNEAALSRPINTWLKGHLNFNRLRQIWTAVNAQDGYVMFGVSVDSSTTNNAVIFMDFRNYPDQSRLDRGIRWAYWPAYDAASLAPVVDTNGVRRIWMGGNDGKVYRTMTSARSIAGSTAISAKATTPYLSYGDPIMEKTLYTASVGLSPKGNYNLTFGWQRDTFSQQTQEVEQGGGDVLGPSSVDPFTLGTSALAGSMYTDRYMDLQEGGEFRNIQYQLTQNNVDEDMEVHSISAGIKGGAVSTEN